MSAEHDTSPVITQTRILPIDDSRLLEEATLGFANTIVEIRRPGEKYHTFATFRHGGKGRHLLGRELEVREGEAWIAIRTAANNFGLIDSVFKELKQAREEKVTTRKSLS